MQVYVTPRAERNFDTIISYIQVNWGESTAKQFVIRTDEILKLLRSILQWGKLKAEI